MTITPVTQLVKNNKNNGVMYVDHKGLDKEFLSISYDASSLVRDCPPASIFPFFLIVIVIPKF